MDQTTADLKNLIRSYVSRSELPEVPVLENALRLVTPTEVHRQLLTITEESTTAIHQAARLVHLEILETLLDVLDFEQRNDLLSVEDNMNCTALHYAAQFGNPGLASCILKSVSEEHAKSLVLKVDAKGYTPIMRAAKDDYHVTIQAILEPILKPASKYEVLAVQDNQGDTALHIVANSGHTETARCLLDSVESSGRVRLLKKVDKWRSSAIHWAASKGHPGCLGVILESVDVEASYELMHMLNDESSTALKLAKKKQNKESAEVLRRRFREYEKMKDTQRSSNKVSDDKTHESTYEDLIAKQSQEMEALRETNQQQKDEIERLTKKFKKSSVHKDCQLQLLQEKVSSLQKENSMLKERCKSEKESSDEIKELMKAENMELKERLKNLAPNERSHEELGRRVAFLAKQNEELTCKLYQHKERLEWHIQHGTCNLDVNKKYGEPPTEGSDEELVERDAGNNIFSSADTPPITESHHATNH